MLLQLQLPIGTSLRVRFANPPPHRAAFALPLAIVPLPFATVAPGWAHKPWSNSSSQQPLASMISTPLHPKHTFLHSNRLWSSLQSLCWCVLCCSFDFWLKLRWVALRVMNSQLWRCYRWYRLIFQCLNNKIIASALFVHSNERLRNKFKFKRLKSLQNNILNNWQKS